MWWARRYVNGAAPIAELLLLLLQLLQLCLRWCQVRQLPSCTVPGSVLMVGTHSRIPGLQLLTPAAACCQLPRPGAANIHCWQPRTVASQALSRADIAPALETLKKKLMERNVAEEIADK